MLGPSRGLYRGLSRVPIIGCTKGDTRVAVKEGSFSYYDKATSLFCIIYPYEL